MTLFLLVVLTQISSSNPVLYLSTDNSKPFSPFPCQVWRTSPRAQKNSPWRGYFLKIFKYIKFESELQISFFMLTPLILQSTSTIWKWGEQENATLNMINGMLMLFSKNIFLFRKKFKWITKNNAKRQNLAIELSSIT